MTVIRPAGDGGTKVTSEPADPLHIPTVAHQTLSASPCEGKGAQCHCGSPCDVIRPEANRASTHAARSQESQTKEKDVLPKLQPAAQMLSEAPAHLGPQQDVDPDAAG